MLMRSKGRAWTRLDGRKRSLGRTSRFYGVLPALLRLLLFAAAVVPHAAQAVEKKFGSFVVDTDHPTVLLLNGPIDIGSALDFRRALEFENRIRVLALNSQGGIAAIGLLIADDVHSRDIATFVDQGSACYSACAFIFFAGKMRTVEGRLGVHQISSETPNLESAQLTISDILDRLNKFDTPNEVLTVMFRTPANSIYVFSPEEIARFGINRTGSEAAPSEKPPRAGPPPPPPPIPGKKQRVAIYVGLDFYGADFRSFSVNDLPQCASQCLRYRDSCKIFTYNTGTSVHSGPNCFIKDRVGVADGNGEAISGLMLAPTDPDPRPFEVGVIDPKDGLLKDTDLPFNDLFKEPRGNVTTAQQCRLQCVQSRACQAFTFVKNKRECWLKDSAPYSVERDDMTSGIKRSFTFTPTEIVTLE